MLTSSRWLASYKRPMIWYWPITNLTNESQAESDLLEKSLVLITLILSMVKSGLKGWSWAEESVRYFSLPTLDYSDLLNSTWATSIQVSNTICYTCWQHGCWKLVTWISVPEPYCRSLVWLWSGEIVYRILGTVQVVCLEAHVRFTGKVSLWRCENAPVTAYIIWRSCKINYCSFSLLLWFWDEK